MSWSLGETGALAIKAARGAGFAWGLAEDAGFAVVWLQARGLPGAVALCSYLSWYAANNHRQDEQTGRCPLLTGAAISDGVISTPQHAQDEIDLGLVRRPLLLLPFISNLDGGMIILDGLSWQNDAGPTHAAPAGLAPCRLRRLAAPPKQALPITHSRLETECAGCVETLGRLAHRTYAPATPESRLAGAGAGLTDND